MRRRFCSVSCEPRLFACIVSNTCDGVGLPRSAAEVLARRTGSLVVA
jgi:hypothetical protein